SPCPRRGRTERLDSHNLSAVSAARVLWRHPGPALEGAAELARVAETDRAADIGHAQRAGLQQLQRPLGAHAVVDLAEDPAAFGQLAAQRALAEIQRARHLVELWLLREP